MGMELLLDVGYPRERNKIKFLPRVSETIKLLNKNESASNYNV